MAAGGSERGYRAMWRVPLNRSNACSNFGDYSVTRKYATFQTLVLDEWLLDRPDECSADSC